MKTQINYLKVLFLSLVFLFSPFLHANPTNEGCITVIATCVSCGYHGLFVTINGNDYCGSCGIWYLGEVIAAPPGLCYCSNLDLFVPHYLHGDCSCGHSRN